MGFGGNVSEGDSFALCLGTKQSESSEPPAGLAREMPVLSAQLHYTP